MGPLGKSVGGRWATRVCRLFELPSRLVGGQGKRLEVLGEEKTE